MTVSPSRWPLERTIDRYEEALAMSPNVSCYMPQCRNVVEAFFSAARGLVGKSSAQAEALHTQFATIMDTYLTHLRLQGRASQTTTTVRRTRRRQVSQQPAPTQETDATVSAQMSDFIKLAHVA